MECLRTGHMASFVVKSTHGIVSTVDLRDQTERLDFSINTKRERSFANTFSHLVFVVVVFVA